MTKATSQAIDRKCANKLFCGLRRLSYFFLVYISKEFIFLKTFRRSTTESNSLNKFFICVKLIMTEWDWTRLIYEKVYNILTICRYIWLACNVSSLESHRWRHFHFVISNGCQTYRLVMISISADNRKWLKGFSP